MKTHIQLVILTLLLCSCGQAPNKEALNTTDSVSTNPISHNPENSTNESFKNFWQTFRRAVLDRDTNTLISLTTFPIETRGPMDSDAIVSYSKTNFTKVFDLYLLQGSGLEEGSELDYIKKVDIPDTSDYSAESARIGNLQFSYQNKRWSLTFIYLIPQTIDEINKNGW